MAFILVIWPKSPHLFTLFNTHFFLFAFCFFFPQWKRGKVEEPPTLHCKPVSPRRPPSSDSSAAADQNFHEGRDFCKATTYFGARSGAFIKVWLEMATYNCETMLASPLVGGQDGGQDGGHLLFCVMMIACR